MRLHIYRQGQFEKCWGFLNFFCFFQKISTLSIYDRVDTLSKPFHLQFCTSKASLRDSALQSGYQLKAF